MMPAASLLAMLLAMLVGTPAFAQVPSAGGSQPPAGQAGVAQGQDQSHGQPSGSGQGMPSSQPANQSIATDGSGKTGTETASAESLLQIRDPFKRMNVATQGPVPTSPLERFSSEQFKMIGAITGAKRLRAMLLDPDGKTHFVAEKMKIGNKRGVIKRITSDTILINEHVTNALGQDEIVEVELKLPNEGLETPLSGFSESKVGDPATQGGGNRTAPIRERRP